MNYAYEKVYLERAQQVLGVAFDFAVNKLGIDLNDFFLMFLVSGISEKFGYGDFEVIAGRSGTELAYEVTELCGIKNRRKSYAPSFSRSMEYWTGWALAYFQWYAAVTFEEINKAVAIKEISGMYEKYHEMDILQFCDEMNELVFCKDSNPIKERRTAAGFSQSMLAEKSGVPLRTLQQYEQQQKDINKARGEYLVKMARVLGCDVNDLMRKYPKETR